MAKQFYNNLDLNLLRTFQIIFQEKNLQKASLRLHVSAPALSKSLNRLRDHFNDPLFVKVPQGLSPTPFAKDLQVAEHSPKLVAFALGGLAFEWPGCASIERRGHAHAQEFLLPHQFQLMGLQYNW